MKVIKVDSTIVAPPHKGVSSLVDAQHFSEVRFSTVAH